MGLLTASGDVMILTFLGAFLVLMWLQLYGFAKLVNDGKDFSGNADDGQYHLYAIKGVIPLVYENYNYIYFFLIILCLSKISYIRFLQVYFAFLT